MNEEDQINKIVKMVIEHRKNQNKIGYVPFEDMLYLMVYSGDIKLSTCVKILKRL